MIYLASAYSHINSFIRHERFLAACCASAHLMRAGLCVFSPIAHSHPMVAFGLPTNWEFWQKIDREFLAHCDVFVVLTLPGWEESKGVTAELEIARELGLPVLYLSPELQTEEIQRIEDACKSKS